MAGLGSTPELVIGIAAGAAASTALEPALEIPKQDAWDSARNRILNEGLLAQLVARGGVDLSTAHYFAHRNGMDDDQFGALVYMAQTTPGLAEALRLLRLGLIPPDLFTHALIHSGLDQRYIGPLSQLTLRERVGLGDIAYGVVRGILPAPKYVPVPPPTGGTSVPRFPPLDIDPETLAAQIGFSPEMLHLMVGRSGLSLAPGLAATALFRNLINENDYLLAIAEGDLRTEWADTLRDASRQILTSGEYVEAELRGWIDTPTRRKHTQKHGMSDADSDLLFQVQGRPMNARQVFQAERRGGVYDGPIDQIDPAFLKSLRESNIRPEWYNLEWAYRFTQPSVFVIRQYIRDGNDPAWAHEKLLAIGWSQADIDVFVAAYTPGGGTTSTDPHVAKAQTQLWTTTHRAYLNHKLTDAAATAALTAAGVTAAAAPQVLTLWQAERNLDRKPLSAAQTKKAWVEQVVNPETGVAWTRDEALAALIELGYSSVDANTFLEL